MNPLTIFKHYSKIIIKHDSKFLKSQNLFTTKDPPTLSKQQLTIDSPMFE